MGVVVSPMLAHLKDLPDLEQDIFEQVAALDDDQEGFEFTNQLIDQFFDQAQQTITNIESLIVQKRLPEISKLGHFLKGSAAALGLAKMRTVCEAIQHYGSGKDPYNGMVAISEDQILTKISILVATLKDLNATSRAACDNLIKTLQHSIK